MFLYQKKTKFVFSGLKLKVNPWISVLHQVHTVLNRINVVILVMGHSNNSVYFFYWSKSIKFTYKPSLDI